MESNNKKIVVGLSGGVDSSVSLLLLKKQGYEPIGVSLKYSSWKNKKNLLKENICCSTESFNIAKKVCHKLKVPYHIIDERVDFEKKVMGYFLSVLKKKKTPNPCLVCNRLVKFNKLFEFAKKNNIKYVATGHYAKVRKNKKTNLYELIKGKDSNKDQSYFLCLLKQNQLKNIIFPLGDYTKEEVYKIAKRNKFNFFSKIRQSQDLCFIDNKSIKDYLKKEIGIEPGDIVDNKGNVLGKHQGLHFYTIGQRKGINLPNGPWWVVKKDIKTNQLIVVNKENDSALFNKKVIISNYYFISGKIPEKVIKVKAKIRFGQKGSSGKLCIKNSNTLELIFNKPQKAITPGQWAVFYQGNVCLGGGVIE
ncbi:tRNA 2-thiouridine(34) synthase MnmA [Patescibacteria group bacterium]|nr:tRNA 2-thiouridine(34) synthase MnmA [Patescibacteria group bacterium]